MAFHFPWKFSLHLIVSITRSLWNSLVRLLSKLSSTTLAHYALFISRNKSHDPLNSLLNSILTFSRFSWKLLHFRRTCDYRRVVELQKSQLFVVKLYFNSNKKFLREITRCNCNNFICQFLKNHCALVFFFSSIPKIRSIPFLRLFYVSSTISWS